MQQPGAKLVQWDLLAGQPAHEPPVKRQRLRSRDQQRKRLLQHLERRIEFVTHAAAPS
jgi:hypothetical protein